MTVGYARHPLVHFHYTPTHASWLNQIEVWFTPGSLKQRYSDGEAVRHVLVHRHYLAHLA